MLRIAVWRLLLEWLTLLKVLGVRGKDTYYFAFGANLDPSVMLNRGMGIKGCAPAYAQGYALKFSQAVPYAGVGMASMEKSPGSTLPGVIYTLPAIDLRIMDCWEAYAVLRRHKKSTILLNGKNCVFYHAADPTDGLLPGQGYLQKLVTGYKKHFGQDNPLVRKLEAQPSIPLLLPKTPPHFLIRDYARWGSALRPALERYDALCVKVFVYLIYKPAIFRRWLKTSGV